MNLKLMNDGETFFKKKERVSKIGMRELRENIGGNACKYL